ncbi:MAG: YrbL family protein [Syntrophales bacterium]|jgi:hypothetical protein|nr:YrbL family protein [Syntrophales bacterium]
MLELEKARMVGRGKHRACYAHPHDGNLCVKVLLPQKSKTPLIEAAREVAYYDDLLEKRGVPWTMLPKYHGEIPTSRGRGFVFDMIRDHDGGVSRTLGHYLASSEDTDRYAEPLGKAFDRLKDYLLEWRIVTKTLKAKNILCQKIREDEVKLVVVDNIGTSDFIPVSKYIDFLAERKIRRKWRQFERDLRKTYPKNALVQRKFKP